MSSPMVSILMTVFNEEKYISEAIESAINQTYSNFELIIIDDASTDKTVEIIKKYLDNNKIKFYQPGKIGKVAAFNLAFSKSNGDFICFFGGDDILLKDSIEKRLGSIKDIFINPVILFCKIKTLSKIKKFDGLIIPKNNKGNLSGGTMIFNKEFANISFPIPEFLGNEDMWQVQHANYYPGVIVKHISYIGLRYRIHSNNSSSKLDSFNKKTESMHERFIVYKIFLDKYKKMLNQNSINKLKSLSLAEDLRYDQKSLSILLMNNLTIKERARFFVFSNRLFYSIRKKMFSLFSGW